MSYITVYNNLVKANTVFFLAFHDNGLVVPDYLDKLFVEHFLSLNSVFYVKLSAIYCQRITFL